MKQLTSTKPFVMAGLLLGGMLPFLFSSLAMGAVGRAAMDMIQEVRRQFNNIPELKAALWLS
jgi:K(+)-stimulated pyrophosphate-energized sodium pump